MKLYLVNDTTASGDNEVLMPSYKLLSDAIDYVNKWVLNEPHFHNLSKHDRDGAALEWIIEVDTF